MDIVKSLYQLVVEYKYIAAIVCFVLVFWMFKNKKKQVVDIDEAIPDRAIKLLSQPNDISNDWEQACMQTIDMIVQSKKKNLLKILVFFLIDCLPRDASYYEPIAANRASVDSKYRVQEHARQYLVQLNHPDIIQALIQYPSQSTQYGGYGRKEAFIFRMIAQMKPELHTDLFKTIAKDKTLDRRVRDFAESLLQGYYFYDDEYHYVTRKTKIFLDGRRDEVYR